MSHPVNDLIIEAHLEECMGLTGKPCTHTNMEIFDMYEGPEPDIDEDEE